MRSLESSKLAGPSVSPLAVVECCSPLVLYSFLVGSPFAEQNPCDVKLQNDVDSKVWIAFVERIFAQHTAALPGLSGEQHPTTKVPL
ncbi:hypothetical protein SDC9_144073 [bioreactor metagenome]|uniref:Uncharacterized protein n=1 Tax=bioreactor metagenome TaxID=1076179 RepID=A0A645E583_9ZZZZ